MLYAQGSKAAGTHFTRRQHLCSSSRSGITASLCPLRVRGSGHYPPQAVPSIKHHRCSRAKKSGPSSAPRKSTTHFTSGCQVLGKVPQRHLRTQTKSPVIAQPMAFGQSSQPLRQSDRCVSKRCPALSSPNLPPTQRNSQRRFARSERISSPPDLIADRLRGRKRLIYTSAPIRLAAPHRKRPQQTPFSPVQASSPGKASGPVTEDSLEERIKALEIRVGEEVNTVNEDVEWLTEGEAWRVRAAQDGELLAIADVQARAFHEKPALAFLDKPTFNILKVATFQCLASWYGLRVFL